MTKRSEIQTSTTKQIQRLERQVAELTAKLNWYEEQFRLAQQKRFGASSEKTTHPDQLALNLFNEAEVLATPEGKAPPTEQITYERRKTKNKQKTDWEHLPVEPMGLRMRNRFVRTVAVPFM